MFLKQLLIYEIIKKLSIFDKKKKKKKKKNVTISMNILVIIGLILLLAIAIYCILYCTAKLILYLTFTPYTKIYPYNPSDLPDETKTIRIFDLNCFWRPWLLHIGTIEHVRERSQLVSQRLDNFDVVCLNESFHYGSTVVRDFVKVMQEKGFKYVVTTGRVPIFSHWVVDSGVMILSRYPITKTDYIAYKKANHWCWWAMKSCVYARIQISKKQHINVFATHLQATAVNKHEIHIDQFKDIHYLMMKHCSTDTAPTFLMGDMNTGSEDTKHYNEMLEGIKMPNYKITDTFQKVTDRKRTIDYMFLYESKDETDFKVKNYDIQYDDMDIEGKPYKNISDHPCIKSSFEFE